MPINNSPIQSYILGAVAVLTTIAAYKYGRIMGRLEKSTEIHRKES